MAAMYGAGDEILVEGTCGKDITFTLTRDGVLTLSGTGDTYNYHSQKFPEWLDYIDYILEIRVEEGITGLGSMIFRNCTSVKKVTLPDSLTNIGQYGFGGCVSIAEMTLPANIATLGNSVFSGTVLQEIHYAGDNWDTIELGTGNDDFVNRVVKDNEITNEQNANSSSTIADKTQNTNSSSTIADKTQNNISNQVKDNAGKVNKSSKVKGLKLKKKKVKNSKNGKVNKKKANLKISWKKVKGANGYQIVMKTGKKGKYKIVKTIKKNAKTTFVKKNLKKGKKYFVKVRAYQVVKGKKIYGKYCKAKMIKL